MTGIKVWMNGKVVVMSWPMTTAVLVVEAAIVVAVFYWLLP